MKKIVLASILVVSALLFCTSNTKVAGTNDETLSGIEAKLYNPDGTKAVGATVKFFTPQDSLRQSVYQTQTDTNGSYSVTGLSAGYYNIWAEKDSLVAYQASVSISPQSNEIKKDTLRSPSTLTGFVKVEPNHDPRYVTVQVLGTEIYASPDTNGTFTLKKIDGGDYSLRVTVALPDYQVAFPEISVRRSVADTLRDTINLQYLGIPIVTGLQAVYDTLNGVVRLSWDKTSYRDFQDFLVYRDLADSARNPSYFAARVDTFFVDSVFKRGIASGKFSFSDSNDYRFRYRICVRDNSDKLGSTYKYAEIVAASPTKVKTVFEFGKPYHLGKGFFTDSASVNDTMRFVVRVENPNRNLRRIEWRECETGVVVRSVELDTMKNVAADTVRYVWGTLGRKRLECKVVDVAGAEWKDTVYVSVVTDKPDVYLSTTTPEVSINDSIKLYASGFDKYGEIVTWELDEGNTGSFRQVQAGNLLVFAPSTQNSNYKCVLKGTDDDGNLSFDSVVINVLLNAPVVHLTATPLEIMTGDTIQLHVNASDNYGRIVKTEWSFGDTTNFTIWNSADKFIIAPSVPMWSYICAVRVTDDDGNVITKVVLLRINAKVSLVTSNAGFTSYAGHSSVVFDDKIWVIGGALPDYKACREVWYSSDGVIWLQATSNAAFPGRIKHQSFVFENKIWVLGGYHPDHFAPNIPSYNDVWYSSDGITWIQATDSAGFFKGGCNTAIVYDSKMWVLSGPCGIQKIGVWYSSDGANWTQTTESAVSPNRQLPSSIAFDNKMWIIGGYYSVDTYQTTIPPCLNDSWYSNNGITWTQATASAAFPGRAPYAGFVFNNKMWIIGGIGPNTKEFNDIWYSSDGISWSQFPIPDTFTIPQWCSILVFNNKLWFIGDYQNSIWNIELGD